LSWRERSENNLFAPKNKNDENDFFRQSPQKMEPGARYFNQLLNAQDSGAGPDGKPASSWNGGFPQPVQPKQTPDQLAEMERFRAMMEPSSPSDKVPVPTRFSVATAPAADPFLQAAPLVNPAGRAIPPLGNAFSRPTGIKPLTGISTPPPTPVTIRPVWQAQLPPWMNEGAPPVSNPNRNF
jgi:hypothetical protein